MALDTNFNITEIDESRLDEVDKDNLGFGRVFADHMLEVDFQGDEWETPQIKPYGNIEVTPALSVFHYAQSVFEGAKAYYVDEETINLFRIEQNYKRFARSCKRMCIPVIDQDTFVNGIKQLIKLDYKWVPSKEGRALYIRPFAMGMDPYLAASPAENYRFCIINSPVAAYFNKPVKLMTAEKYIRSATGGIGNVKASANYGPAFYPAKQAQEQGYSQIMWLDAAEHKYVEEVGTMNMFFVIDGVLLTPDLHGTILPGITRDSIIQLAKSWNMPVEERRITIEEVMQAGRDDTLDEAFGAGTAAVISHVEEIKHQEESIEIHKGSRGPVAQKIYETITGIQYGKREDPFGWTTSIDVS